MLIEALSIFRLHRAWFATADLFVAWSSSQAVAASPLRSMLHGSSAQFQFYEHEPRSHDAVFLPGALAVFLDRSLDTADRFIFTTFRLSRDFLYPIAASVFFILFL